MQCTCPILSSTAFPALQQYSTLSHKRNDVRGKKLMNVKCVLIFSATFVGNISHSKENSARYNLKRTYAFTYSTRLYCQILMELLFSQQTFERYRNIKCHEDPSCGSREDPCGRTDMTKFTVAFRYFPNAPKMVKNCAE